MYAQKQATSHNKSQSTYEATVISATAEEESPSMLSHPESPETVTNGRKMVLKGVTMKGRTIEYGGSRTS